VGIFDRKINFGPRIWGIYADQNVIIQLAGLFRRYGLSDPHRHYDIPVLVVFAFGGTELAGGLGVFKFEANVA
jgi:hypothetical protein